MKVGDLVARKSVIVCVGPGGVGKTTVSAAVGLAGALAGRRTVVLTIDPARRLADALGLAELDDSIAPVPLEALPDRGEGTLDAAMVDVAKSYAALIDRIAPDARTRDRILDNRVFQAISRSMAQSHAYIAMERLYDAVQNAGYDLVVLDTPPARNALDILDAPRQLARFLDARFVDWFLPGERQLGLRDRIVATGGRLAKGMLGLVTGPQLLDEIVAFLDAFGSLREGFVARAQACSELLTGGRAGYVLVSSTSAASADDASWLRHDLERRGVPIDAVVFNQAYDPIAAGMGASMADVAPLDEGQWQALGVREAGAEAVLRGLRQLRRDAAAGNRLRFDTVSGVRAELPAGCTCVSTPRFDEEIRTLPGLVRLSRWLTDTP